MLSRSTLEVNHLICIFPSTNKVYNSKTGYNYFLLTIAKKNSTRIETPIKGIIISPKGLSKGTLCSKNS